MYSSLRDVEAIFHVKNQSLTTFDSLVTNSENLVEVFILAFIAIDFKDIFEAVEESVERRLMLQHEEVEQISDCSFLVR